ncbi:exo-beta-N-acetylmuramidase NamZ domain-containing protein, partial [Acidobacteriota bacterium]
MNSFRLFFLLVMGVAVLAACRSENTSVRVGLDMLLSQKASLLAGKRIGIITNQSGITSTGIHIVDALSQIPGITVTALFAPEHGIRGDLPDGTRDASYRDDRTGIQVWSLYGRYFKPTPEMLEDIDVLVFDIQDVGARFYTFISTMGLAMEAAAEKGIQFIVLDRPNPITGNIIEGPILEEKFSSFVGKYPIPVRYGMTPGELAQMIKGQDWMKGMDRLDLDVVRLEGWQRSMWYDETGLPWIEPSPNIPHILTAILYPGMCLVEALNVSEGRGTMKPFEQMGAPWIEGNELADRMNSLLLPGIFFKAIFYTPSGLPGAAPQPKYKDETIQGLELIVTDREALRAVDVMVHLFVTLKE